MICNKCNTEKHDEAFPWKFKDRGIKALTCKECQKIASRAHYYANKQDYRKRNTRQRYENKHWYLELKTKFKCDRCDEDNPACIDFHHLDPSTKISTVSSLRQSYGKRKVLEEIAKCIPLCANCHRKEHFASIYPLASNE